MTKQELILSILNKTNSITIEGLQQEANELTQEEFQETLNILVSEKRIEVLTLQGKMILKARNDDEVQRYQTMNQNEIIVYQFIKDAGNKGTWVKHIKEKSGLHTKIVNDAIKSLEKHKHIKLIKSVKNPTKKVYMLYDLEPNEELTGGSWYDDEKMDIEFINQLSNHILKFIQSKSLPTNEQKIYSTRYAHFPSLSQIHSFITKSGITTQPLSMEDVKSLVERLVYDGQVKRLDLEEDQIYQAKRNYNGFNGYIESPCGKCPVFSFCKEGGPVQPSSCEYLAQWLEF
ncbi:34-kDa subunit of RNA polymerase III (C) [Boothiomyces sp. JEL0838]|nr:34-kDa subunit of RNA polymerase III (C) [Boothiomyces sp. JEL0838]